jgi:hypothetical protein
MDPSIIYLSLFTLCLLLSWYLYKTTFTESGMGSEFSAFMNSGGKFFFYLIVLLFLSYIVFSTNRAILEIFFRKSFLSAIEPSALILVGSILFQFGFTKMSELQVIRNTPRSKIRSVAMGIVEISGRIVSEHVLTTPYSKSPCVYYRSELQIYRSYRSSDDVVDYRWENLSSESFKIPFWIKDETGQMMVDPESAEFKISDRAFGFLKPDGTPQEDVAENFSPQAGDQQYIEKYLSPNDVIFVFGTAGLKTEGTKSHVVIQRGNADSTFIISDDRQKDVVSDTKWEMLAGLTYGVVLFITGFFEILHLSNLL